MFLCFSGGKNAFLPPPYRVYKGLYHGPKTNRGNVIRPFMPPCRRQQDCYSHPMTNENDIIKHYSQDALGEKILNALNDAGKDLKALTIDDLATVDEFHIGGRAMTAHLMTYLQFQPDMHILDIGCGIGGAARYAAEKTKCRLTAIDLTPEYCNAAALLTQTTGLQEHIIYRHANALSLPFMNDEFDGAYTIHAGMNIGDKHTLYREASRVLQPGAFFGIYDVLRGDNAEHLDFPVPWAGEPTESALATLEEMRTALGQAGFEILVEDNLAGYGLIALNKLSAAPPQPGPALVMGDTYPVKIQNLIHNIEKRRCAPWVIICRKRKWDDQK